MRTRNAGLVEVKATGFSRMLVRLASAQSIPAAGAIIAFDTVSFDRNGEYSAGTGSFTAKHAGVYRATACVLFGYRAWPAGRFDLLLQKNAVDTVSTLYVLPGALTEYIQLRGEGLLLLNAGDILSVVCRHPLGAAATLHPDPHWTTFSVERLP